jgi:hypothetical protein
MEHRIFRKKQLCNGTSLLWTCGIILKKGEDGLNSIAGGFFGLRRVQT